ncbi:MAG: endolytic transglycosylase MltG [Paracoccaceae bacterium]|nr:endolytic transglycosylase MltG [Paracoccaceae bacterium]
MRNIAGNALTVLVVAGLVLLIAVGYAKRQFSAPGPLEEEVVVLIPRGADLRDTSRQLALHGAIENTSGSEWLFRVGARYSDEDSAIRYGEYRIPAKASMEEILDLLVSGKAIQHKVTVAEGLSSYEVAELLRGSEILTGEIADVPPEGSLAPETYFIERNMSRKEVVERMTSAQKAILDEAWAGREEGLPLQSPEEVLILASIVEKETGVASERAKVASVFVNRLRRGMKLQSDPTVVYGITEGKGPLGRGLRRSELDRATPYNTYAVNGLPPTPIANPGRDAIMAVVNPDETDFLYFVADGSGGHAFAKTLEEHNKNVSEWRKIENNNN